MAWTSSVSVLVLLVASATVTGVYPTEFYIVPSTTSGPIRLSVGWTEPSLITCVISCQSRYSSQCWSVIYNNRTGMCTPGKWLDSTQPAPSIEEGYVYLRYNCDGNFIIHVYNDIPFCLFHNRRKITYMDAQDECVTFNSYLYTPKSVDKMQLLKSIINYWNWIGLDDRASEGHLVWIDDHQEISEDYKKATFKPGEPNDRGGNEDCVTLANDDFVLVDASCDRLFTSVCEREM